MADSKKRDGRAPQTAKSRNAQPVESRGELSPAAYARHRGLSHNAIKRAIADGRLIHSVRKAGKHVLIDPAVADREWEANTRPRAPNGSAVANSREAASYAAARAVREHFEARMAKLKYEERQRLLVEAEKVDIAWRTIVTRARNRMLAVSSKCRQRLPELPREWVAVIDEEIRAGLEELARPEP